MVTLNLALLQATTWYEHKSALYSKPYALQYLNLLCCVARGLTSVHPGRIYGDANCDGIGSCLRLAAVRDWQLLVSGSCWGRQSLLGVGVNWLLAVTI